MRSKRPRMVFANKAGEIFDHPTLLMAVNDGHCIRLPRTEELIPLPPGSDLYTMPGRIPIGIHPHGGHPELWAEDGAVAVSSFIAPAYLRLLHPAAQKHADAPALPTYAYTALGWMEDRFFVTAVRVDPERRQDPLLFDLVKIKRNATRLVEAHADNRLIRHLEKCALVYGCRAAQNFFLRRWEAPLPTSPACNAACEGCLSLQPEGNIPASHERIDFIPASDEIAEVALMHFKNVKHGVASFGQGCEGEPLLVAHVLEEAIRKIRKKTAQGTINLNTNASLPDKVEKLVLAGLDSMRVTIASAQSGIFDTYHKPRHYGLKEIRDSMTIVKKHGRFLSLNLLVFPGVTDTEREMESLLKLGETIGFDMIQMRNLNIDPDDYIKMIACGDLPIGLRLFMARLKQRMPRLAFGYFNPPRERWSVHPSGDG